MTGGGAGEAAGRKAVLSLFCRKLEPCFSRFPGGKRAPFIRAVCDQLQEFEEAVLGEAASRILKAAKGMTWPNVGELYQTCAAVRDERRRKAELIEAALDREPEERYPLPDEVALEIMARSDAGLCLRAMKEGYHPLIFEHVKVKRAMPTAAECAALARRSRERLAEAQARYRANPCSINTFYLRGLLGRRETLARLLYEAIDKCSAQGGA